MPLVTIDGQVLNLNETGPRNWGREGNNFAVGVASELETIKETATDTTAELVALIEAIEPEISEEFLQLVDTPAAALPAAGALRLRQNGDLLQASVGGNRYLTIARGAEKIYNVLDYGADPTGVADSTTAFRNAIAAATATTRGHRVYAPSGTYLLSDYIRIEGVRGFDFYGDGDLDTRLVWRGVAVSAWTISTAVTVGAKRTNGDHVYRCITAGTTAGAGGPTGTTSDITDGTAHWAWHMEGDGVPIIQVRNAQYVTIRDMEIQGYTVAPPIACIDSVSNSLSYVFVPTGNRFVNLAIGGGSASSGLPNMADYGVRYRLSAGSLDYNNSEGYHENLNITCCRIAAWSAQHTQSKAHTLINCNFNECGNGISTMPAGGGFTWLNGNMGNIGTSELQYGICFRLGAPNDPILILGMNSEGCKRLLFVNDGVGGASPYAVTMKNVRFACNDMIEDGRIVDFRFPGPLVIEGCLIQSVDGETAPTFYLLNYGSHKICNNSFSFTDSYLASIIETGSGFGVEERYNLWNDATPGVATIPRAEKGVELFGSGVTTVAVTFAEKSTPLGYAPAGSPNVPRPNLNYAVALSARPNAGTPAAGALRASIANKTTLGFDIVLEAAPGGVASVYVDWSIL